MGARSVKKWRKEPEYIAQPIPIDFILAHLQKKINRQTAF